MNVFTFSAKNGIVVNSLRILDLCRTPATDSTNTWGSIEPRLRTTGIESCHIICITLYTNKANTYTNEYIDCAWIIVIIVVIIIIIIIIVII